MIVVGYTAGAYGQACLEHGIVEARLRDTELLVISAVSEARGQRIVDADEIVAVQQRLDESGVKNTVSQPIGATPSEELLNAMDRPDAELLIIGMRRRTQVGKLLLGSTSQYLLAECPKPILVVKPSAPGRGTGRSDLAPADTADEPGGFGNGLLP